MLTVALLLAPSAVLLALVTVGARRTPVVPPAPVVTRSAYVSRHTRPVVCRGGITPEQRHAYALERATYLAWRSATSRPYGCEAADVPHTPAPCRGGRGARP